MATTNTEDNLIVKEEASENVEVVDDSSPTTTKTEATNDQPNDEPTTPVVQRQRTNSSTSSTSDKQQQQQENNKKQLSKHISEMFENVTQVIQGEMKAGFNELLLLQTMNETVAKRYEGMVDRSQIIQQQIVEVREQCMYTVCLCVAVISSLILQIDR